MMGVGSNRTIVAAHAWVLTSSTIVFAKGHLGGKTVSKWREFGEKGGKMAWRLFCSLFFKKVKFGPQIREPQVRFDSCGLWLIKY